MLAALLAVLLPAPTTLELAQGEPLGPGSAYWGVQDVSLDSAAPEENAGGAWTLVGGPGRTILIQFGDLRRAVGPGKRIASARLVLTYMGEKPASASVGRVLLPWRQGPLHPISMQTVVEVVNPGVPAPKKAAPAGSATWRSRKTGVAWQQPGAAGPSDVAPIPGAKLADAGDHLAVEGLGPAFESMRARPYDNHGLALRFEQPCEFFSSDSSSARPRLVLELEDAPPKAGPDLSVVAIDGPESGGERNFVARVKNVGDAPAKGFSAAWVVNDRVGASVDQPATLAPGAEATLSMRRPIREDGGDRRHQPLGLRIEPLGEDADPANDALVVPENAFVLDVVVRPELAAALKAAGLGAPEDWAQGVVGAFNEVSAPFSRYSFAPDGVLERLRIARVTVGEPPTDRVGDAQVVFGPEDVSVRSAMRKVGLALGLMDLSGSNLPAGTGRVALAGFTQGTVDRFAGYMGGGDTRYEGTVPGSTWLPYEPRFLPVFEAIPPFATRMWAATDVATLNTNVGKRGPDRAAIGRLPAAVLVRATDAVGNPLAGVEIDFYQALGGRIVDGPPAFSVATNDAGLTWLPQRDNGLFGPLTSDGGNGVLLLRTVRFGVSSSAWLKAWQLADMASRGNTGTAILDVPFNVPSAPLDPGNLVANRIAADSAGSPAAQLAGLVDEDAATSSALPADKEAWVEVDLGRDRTIGEVRLVGGPDMWKRFDILVYATGISPTEAVPWSREMDWAYSFVNRAESLDEIREVAYRGSPKRIRYIRIVNRTGGAGRLAGVKAAPSVATP